MRDEEIPFCDNCALVRLVPCFTQHILPHTTLLAFTLLGCCLLLGLQRRLAPSVLNPTLPASDLLFPEKTQLLAFPLHSDESQCSFLVTLKADMVPFTGEWLIPNPNLNCVAMHNQPDSHYVWPNFSLFSLVTKIREGG